MFDTATSSAPLPYGLSVLICRPSLLISFISTPYLRSAECSSQTVIITGSNTGLGLEAARHIVKLNAAKVILAVRTVSKGEAAAADIAKTTGRSGVCEVWPLDLSSYASVKDFIARAHSLERLDVVIENAGVSITTKWTVAEKDEMTITTNVVSTFLLGLGLLPRLRQTAAKFQPKRTPRLVIVSSEVHEIASFKERKAENIFETLSDERRSNLEDRYNVSKLLEVYFCRELAERMRKSGKEEVVVNYLTPGFCQSDLNREKVTAIEVLKFLLARTTEQGSRALVHAAGCGMETHGEYLSQCRITKYAPFFCCKY